MHTTGESHPYDGTAVGDAYAAWQTSHQRLRELERALVETVHAGSRLTAQRALVADIATAREEARTLFEEASKGERNSLRRVGVAGKARFAREQQGRSEGHAR